MFRRCWLVGCSWALIFSSLSFRPPAAFGQSADTATAEALFQQGKQLLRAGKAAAACPKLAESARMEPSTGTLLALAMCDEAVGKLASAWAGFVNVEARARYENRPDREQAARERARALRPRLSTLQVQVPREVAALSGLEIRRDGTMLGPGAWNVAVPVDGAEHTVEVSAPGKAPWKGSVTVKAESDAALLSVPVLPPATPVPPPVAARSRPARKPDQPTDVGAAGHWGAFEWAGVSAAGAGAVALGFGSYFLATALAEKSDSSKSCSGNVCRPQGFRDRSSAVDHGNAATLFGIVGGVLVAGGATLFIVGRTRGHRAESSPSNGGALAIGVAPSGLGVQASIHF